MFIRVFVVCYTNYLYPLGVTEILGLFADKLLMKPSIDCFILICVSFSLSISQYYRVLQLSLNSNNGITSETIARIRQSFIRTRKLIVELDQSMALVIDNITKPNLEILYKFFFQIVGSSRNHFCSDVYPNVRGLFKLKLRQNTLAFNEKLLSDELDWRRRPFGCYMSGQWPGL